MQRCLCSVDLPAQATARLHSPALPCNKRDVWQAGGGAGVIMFLPRNTSLRQLSEALPEGTSCEVERAVLNGFLKGITVYVRGADGPVRLPGPMP